MLKKILVALDGSDNAERSLPWVKRYGRPERAQVVLYRAVGPDFGLPEVEAEALAEAREYLLRMERELNYAGVPCKTRIGRGPAAEAIVEAAAEERADLILMTTRGGSKVSRWLVGGVTEQVMRLSPVPVLVVRSRTALSHQARVRRLVIPVDGSRRAETVIPWAEGLARKLRARIVFLHVYPEWPKGVREIHAPRFDELRLRMNRTCLRMRSRGVRASFKVQRGDAAVRILAYADRNDLIVMTTHGYGGLKRWVFGSVAEKVVHESPTPVLVYKAPAEARRKGVVAV
jgi:nucleotide-binding universal stress UspA family protein